MKKILFINFLMLVIVSNISFILALDIPKQIVYGRVIDLKNQQGISGASIRVLDTKLGAISQQNGNYVIKDIPIGRIQIQASAIGYEPRIYNVVLTSGKQFELQIELMEKIVQTEEIIVSDKRNISESINESIVISSVEFNIDDVSRYAGSRMDPARMVQNYAGVLGANDSRNDIIVRGGSPIELLWSLDGMVIPNPNHFATQGATGGPISAINTNLLRNSDFLTGAFPSEYYDKMSGVFDLNTRRGNINRYEYIFQLGFNGFELGAEGPLSNSSSFIVNYRYSFLGLLKVMGINFGFSGIPEYQDLMLKYDWDIDSKNKISITGLGGISNIYIKESENNDSVYTGDFDIKNGTDLLSLSLNYKYLASEKFFLEAVIGTNYSNFRTTLDSITTNFNHNVLSIDKWREDNDYEGFHLAKVKLNYNIDRQNYITFGIDGRIRYYGFNQERMTVDWDRNDRFKLVKDGNSFQGITFINWNYRPVENVTINTGIASQYFSLSDKVTVEPRIGLKYKIDDNNSVQAGFGVHRQSLPLLIYNLSEYNNKLDFMQSVHYVLGYNYIINNSSFIKIETYYKDLSKIPVDITPSSFSFVNSGTNFGSVFSKDSLISNGTAKSYGVELSYIKNFTDGYYITATASFLRQRYKGSDNIERDGAFDNKFILNLLAGYEWKISNKFTIEFSGKYSLAGGSPYTPVDEEKSKKTNFTYYLDTEAFSLRNPSYNRFDIKIDFRHNFENFAIISFISIENLLNQQNILLRIWDVKNQKEKIVYQLGVFPIGGFKIEF